MNAELLEELKKITPEEERLLRGGRNRAPDLYVPPGKFTLRGRY